VGSSMSFISSDVIVYVGIMGWDKVKGIILLLYLDGII
jgi:hypothetical protein